MHCPTLRPAFALLRRLPVALALCAWLVACALWASPAGAAAAIRTGDETVSAPVIPHAGEARAHAAKTTRRPVTLAQRRDAQPTAGHASTPSAVAPPVAAAPLPRLAAGPARLPAGTHPARRRGSDTRLRGPPARG